MGEEVESYTTFKEFSEKFFKTGHITRNQYLAHIAKDEIEYDRLRASVEGNVMTQSPPQSKSQYVPRRYRPQEPEKRVVLENYPDSYSVAQIEDHHGFWRLGCTCPDYMKTKPGMAAWCTHLDDAMKNHKDVQVDGLVDTWAQVTVIVKPIITANLHLTDPDINGFRTATLMVPDPQNSWIEKSYLGMIHQSAGRLELRNAVLEFLMEWVDIAEDQGCKAAQHHPGKSPIEHVDENLTEKGLPNLQVLADVFDLATTGICRRCNEDSGVPEIGF